MDWFPWYPIIYREDTLNFTLAQDGAYRRLIDHYMETRRPLPAGDIALCRIIGIGIDEFHAIAEQVLSKFIEIEGELHHEKCNEVLDSQDSLSKKRSDVAKAGHKKRNKNKSMLPKAKQKLCNSKDTGQDRTGEDRKKEDASGEPDYDKVFEGWWINYPRKIGKGKAKERFIKVLKTKKATIEHMTVGLQRYCEDINNRGTETQFIAHPSTWINEGRWEDEYSTIVHAKPGGNGQGPVSIVEAIRKARASREGHASSDNLVESGGANSGECGGSGGIIIDADGFEQN